jgi:hypothetical protein
MDLKKLMTGANPQTLMLEQTRGLKAKWEKTGLLENAGSETSKHGMAVMLENQAKQLLDEATRTGTSAGSEEWAGVALPLVRRVFGSIASKEFVSVQPMNLPSGLIFYMDFKYGSAQAGSPDFQNQSLFGKGGTFGKDSLSPAGDKLGSTQTAEGGLYGAGRFGYTINNLTSGSAATVASASANLEVINYDLKNATFSASVASGKVKTLSFSAPADADYNGVRAFELVQSGSGFTLYPEFTKINGSTLTFVAAYSSATIADTVGSTLTYHAQPTDITRGDFEDAGVGNGSPDLGIPEIELELKSEPIVAKTRKLKAIWTPELAQDLNAYHSVDAEAELTQMLSEYISLEIDLEILEMLQQNAFTTERWSARVGYDFNTTTNNFQVDTTAAAASAYTKSTWYQTLGIKLQKVSNKSIGESY